MPEVKIIVATTKKYRMPEDPVYLPVHVGAGLKKAPVSDYTPDNTGDNISEKNASYCELTGLYWAWKNLDADYIGLVHYRRYFASPDARSEVDPFDRIIGGEELRRILEKNTVVVPKKRKYYIESLGSHYAHTHYQEQLDDTLSIISEKYPEYKASFEKVMEQTSGYMFNMLIMRRDVLDRYCTWLFDILGELENRRSDVKLDSYQGRYIGRVAEIIFNVWLDYQMESGKLPRFQIQELPCVHIERINWFKKGSAFLAAKLFHKRYKHSF
ncbi:MAG: DUF4422 domain-containing protein [Lachnospiraceae bacterium]|nr:DUF4422 domain-containing protein [Lachnospiraceae bacterium]